LGEAGRSRTWFGDGWRVTESANFSFQISSNYDVDRIVSARTPWPARAIRTVDQKVIDMIRAGADIYVRRWHDYAKGLKRIG
jgi:hypothetical protein